MTVVLYLVRNNDMMSSRVCEPKASINRSDGLVLNKLPRLAKQLALQIFIISQLILPPSDTAKTMLLGILTFGIFLRPLKMIKVFRKLPFIEEHNTTENLFFVFPVDKPSRV